MKRNKKKTGYFVGLFLSLCMILSAYNQIANVDFNTQKTTDVPATQIPDNSSGEISLSLDDIPEYSGSPYVEINDNIPFFMDEAFDTTSYEYYSELDKYGRCGKAMAIVGQDIMPTEERGKIGMIKPTGWRTVKYDCVDGKYLYNRCHLIGYQLTGENANEKNLITGTRYLNVEGMLPFENQIAEYVHNTDNHVVYRVTPLFDGNNLLADGVLMEAQSVEDSEICFNVFVYNVQPGVVIDYATGESWLDENVITTTDEPDSEIISFSDGLESTYIINENTRKFHTPNCTNVATIMQKNKKEYFVNRDELVLMGYKPCKQCNP